MPHQKIQTDLSASQSQLPTEVHNKHTWVEPHTILHFLTQTYSNMEYKWSENSFIGHRIYKCKNLFEGVL